VNAYNGPPMTLGNAAAVRVRLIVWCLDCQHQVEPDPAEMAERYGAEMTVPDWRKRLVCGQCGSRRVDFVVTGERRDGVAQCGLTENQAPERGRRRSTEIFRFITKVLNIFYDGREDSRSQMNERRLGAKHVSNAFVWVFAIQSSNYALHACFIPFFWWPVKCIKVPTCEILIDAPSEPRLATNDRFNTQRLQCAGFTLRNEHDRNGGMSG
jgi:hypothetical protein